MKSSIRNILLLMAFGTLSACSEQTVTVSYQEYPNAFRNPMKGFREFFAPGIDRVREEYPYPYGSLTKEYMQWNMIEDDANDGVDKIIAYSNHRWKGVEDINVKVIPRVFLVWSAACSFSSESKYISSLCNMEEALSKVPITRHGKTRFPQVGIR